MRNPVNNYEVLISVFQKFIKSRLLPILILFFLIFSCDKKVDIKKIKLQSDFFAEYKKNELLNDANDFRLNDMDTILKFSDKKFFYELFLKKEKFNLKVYRWSELPNNKIAYKVDGFHKDGYIYTKNKLDTTAYTITYKIILNKGLYMWNEYHWELINAGGY